MTKLYKKDKLLFSLVLIGAYVLLASVADAISESIGIEKIATVPFLLLMSFVIYLWISKNRLKAEYGLTKPKEHGYRVLWFMPLLVLISANLWNGVTLNMPITDTALYILSMLCVGFLEEIIFRGFLFRAMCETGVKKAFIISSVTFGVGHIVNLLNGAQLLSTILQIISAVAIGFLFTLIFYKTGSLLPCIITHYLFNSFSAFSVEPSSMGKIISCVAICAIAILYSVCIILLSRGNKENYINL